MTLFKQGKSSLWAHIIIAFCTFIMMSFIYYFSTSVYFSYSGFAQNPSLLKIMAAGGLLLAFVMVIPTVLSVRSFLLTAAVYAYVLPALVLYAMGDVAFAYLLALLLGFVLIFAVSAYPAMRISLIPIKLQHLQYIVLGTAIFLLALIVLYSQFRYFNLNIFKVYEYRKAAEDLLPGVFVYFISPVSKIFIPMGVLFGLYRGKNSIVILSCLLGVLLYGFTSHKTILIAPFFVWTIYYFMKKTRSLIGIHLIFLLVAAFSVIEYLIGNVVNGDDHTQLFANVIIRRVFFLPPLLDSFYIDYFSQHEFFHWAKSRITFNTIYTDYRTTAPYVIGDHYFNNRFMSANSGFIGSGFSNAGYWGIAIYAIILGRVLAILESHGRYIGATLVMSISLVVFLSAITSTDTVTAFLTHGLLFLLLIFSLFQRERH